MREVTPSACKGGLVGRKGRGREGDGRCRSSFARDRGGGLGSRRGGGCRCGLWHSQGEGEEESREKSRAKVSRGTAERSCEERTSGRVVAKDTAEPVQKDRLKSV